MKIFHKHFNNKIVEPFIIFEDDVKKYRDLPEFLQVPNNTDLLYLSKCGLIKDDNRIYYNCIKYDIIDKVLIRIYNMLSTNGILIYSLKGLLTFYHTNLESYKDNIVWDIYLTKMQPYLNVYALKIPLVYQYGEIGGLEEDTKIEYNDNTAITYPDDWKEKKIY